MLACRMAVFLMKNPVILILITTTTNTTTATTTTKGTSQCTFTKFTLPGMRLRWPLEEREALGGSDAVEALLRVDMFGLSGVGLLVSLVGFSCEHQESVFLDSNRDPREKGEDLCQGNYGMKPYSKEVESESFGL